MKEKVSVIVPTYNRANTIGNAITSVNNQSYRPIELVVVDDGSEDNTREVVREFCESKVINDSGIQIIYEAQLNKGAPCARNRGYEIASGEYIQYLDSDDILHPFKIERQVQALSLKSDINVVFSDYETCDRKSSFSDVNSTSRIIRVSPSFISSFIKRARWKTESGLYRREIIRQVGGWNDSITARQDWEFNLRILLSQSYVGYLPGTYSLARTDSSGRISNYVHSHNGLTGGLYAVEQVKQLLQEEGLLNEPEIRSAMFTRYAEVIKYALQQGQKNMSLAVVGQLLPFASTGYSFFKIGIFYTLSLLPPRVCSAVSKKLYRYRSLI